MTSSTSSTNRIGDWVQTYTGRQFWPLDPRPEDVCLEDIAHALSMLCRFNGHCTKFYSVAEHSVYVSRNVPPEHALWALLHDAAEAYVADVPRPLKRFLPNYKEAEAQVMRAVCEHFGLPIEEPESVKRADTALLADEAQQIMASPPAAWFLPEPPTGTRIQARGPYGAELMFLIRFEQLTGSTK